MALNQNQVKNSFIETIVLANAAGRKNEVAYVAELDGVFAYKTDATLASDDLNILAAAGTDSFWVRIGSQNTSKVTFVADVAARDALATLVDNEFVYVAATFMWQRYDLAATSWVDEGVDFSEEEVLITLGSDQFLDGMKTIAELITAGAFSAPSGATVPALSQNVLLINGLHEYNSMVINADLTDDAEVTVSFGLTGDDVLQFISAIALPSANIADAHKAKFG